MFNLGIDIDKTKGEVIAALLTIAFVSNQPLTCIGEDDIWDIYKKFLNKQEQYIVGKKDYEKIIAALKENGLWK